MEDDCCTEHLAQDNVSLAKGIPLTQYSPKQTETSADSLACLQVNAKTTYHFIDLTPTIVNPEKPISVDI